MEASERTNAGSCGANLNWCKINRLRAASRRRETEIERWGKMKSNVGAKKVEVKRRQINFDRGVAEIKKLLPSKQARARNKECDLNFRKNCNKGCCCCS